MKQIRQNVLDARKNFEQYQDDYTKYGWTYLHGSGGIYVDTRVRVDSDSSATIFYDIAWGSIGYDEGTLSRIVKVKYWNSGNLILGYMDQYGITHECTILYSYLSSHSGLYPLDINCGWYRDAFIIKRDWYVKVSDPSATAIIEDVYIDEPVLFSSAEFYVEDINRPTTTKAKIRIVYRQAVGYLNVGSSVYPFLSELGNNANYAEERNIIKEAVDQAHLFLSGFANYIDKILLIKVGR